MASLITGAAGLVALNSVEHRWAQAAT